MLRKPLSLLLPLAVAAGVALGAPAGTRAASDAVKLKSVAWTFNGVFGRFDYPQLRRGLQVYLDVCSTCHGLRLVAYRDLGAIGLSEAEIKEIAGEQEVAGDPDDSGDATTRTAEPKDRFVGPYENVQAAKAANNGAAPPDLSLIVKAREGGADYIYSLLTGYSKPPAGAKGADGKPLKLDTGQHYNKYFAGHVIAMGAPLNSDGQVEYEGKGAPKATVDQMAKDVTAFLTWAAEPYLEERKRMGIKVMLFLLLFTGFMYAIYRHVKKDVKGTA